MTTLIAPGACVDPRAALADDVKVGPFCVIGPDVRIGRGTRLLSHVCLTGHVTIGEFNEIGPFAAIGEPPQDVSYRGSPTRVEIGDCNHFGHGVTVHRGSEKEEGTTRIGSRNTLLASVHVAHDCRLGDGITIAEGTMLGGHVHVEDHARLGCRVAVVHSVTIGGFGSVGMKSKVCQDVPRYMRTGGNPSKVRRVNANVMRRAGFAPAAIEALTEAWRLIFLARVPLAKATAILQAHDQLTVEVERLIEGLEHQRGGKNGRSRDRSS